MQRDSARTTDRLDFHRRIRGEYFRQPYNEVVGQKGPAFSNTVPFFSDAREKDVFPFSLASWLHCSPRIAFSGISKDLGNRYKFARVFRQVPRSRYFASSLPLSQKIY